jgi:hypothetical protein
MSLRRMLFLLLFEILKELLDSDFVSIFVKDCVMNVWVFKVELMIPSGVLTEAKYLKEWI